MPGYERSLNCAESNWFGVIGRLNVKKITVIQLDNRYPDLGHRLIMPRYGTVVIGSLARDLGYDVKIYVEHICKPDMERIKESDYVCFSMMSGSANKSYQMIDEIKKQTSAPVIVGGTHATFFPEDVLKHADFVVRQEGDETFKALLAALENGTSLREIKGLSYRFDGIVIHNCDRPPPPPERITAWPDYTLVEAFEKITKWERLFGMKKRMLCVQSSRGCTRSCSFCITPRMYGSDRYHRAHTGKITGESQR